MGAAIAATCPGGSEPAAEAGRKLEAVRAAVAHEFPTADIDRMLREIEHGYLGEER